MAIAFMPSPLPAAPLSSAFLRMAELPEGNSSRRVVELIFSSGWGAAWPPEPAVEALFQVHSAEQAVARFEEARAAPARTASFLRMAELPEGNSSQRVVELIFSSGWGAAGPPEPSVEALFRVHSAEQAVARFEEARAAARAHGVDGNEIMRFQCRVAASASGVFSVGVIMVGGGGRREEAP